MRARSSSGEALSRGGASPGVEGLQAAGRAVGGAGGAGQGGRCLRGGCQDGRPRGSGRGTVGISGMWGAGAAAVGR